MSTLGVTSIPDFFSLTGMETYSLVRKLLNTVRGPRRMHVGFHIRVYMAFATSTHASVWKRCCSYGRSEIYAVLSVLLLEWLERAMGIEPTSEAWEASILPLYDARSQENRTSIRSITS